MCSKDLTNNIQDFEDLCKTSISDNDIEIYKTIIHNLNVWVLDYIKNQSPIEKLKTNFANEFNKQTRKYKIAARKSNVVTIYRDMLYSNQIEENTTLSCLLQKKPSRNISGITSITLVMSPHPNGQSFSCKHDCYYCPNEPAHEGNNFQDQPRSYLFNEPAVRRANQNDFKAYDQMINRMNTLYANGHTIDKLEIILEGGTYTEYPADYLHIYHRDIFYAANTYFERTSDGVKRGPQSIEKEIEINQTSQVHIIGICIETRPDALNDDWIRKFRHWGVTRIQLGVQHTNNHILKKINRGHTIEQAIDAIELLKDNCFKIDIHLMPDLPNSTPELDIEMFDYVYNYINPDQIKVYPCEVTPWTIIQKWYKTGKYIPYSEINMNDLVEVIKYSMEKCPPHIRLPRVIRDIPISYIDAGNKCANLRQVIDNKLEKENISLMEIRSREIGRHPKYYSMPANYNISKINYGASKKSREYFISYDSYDRKALFGFLRLRLPDTNSHDPVFPSIKNTALIRELHVYGNVNQVGTQNNMKGIQHKGIGKNLLKIAENIAIENNYKKITVISGEGVKEYYKKFDYREIDTYMIKDLYYDFLYNFLYNILYKNEYSVIKSISISLAIYIFCKYIILI